MIEDNACKVSKLTAALQTLQVTHMIPLAEMAFIEGIISNRFNFYRLNRLAKFTPGKNFSLYYLYVVTYSLHLNGHGKIKEICIMIPEHIS